MSVILERRRLRRGEKRDGREGVGGEARGKTPNVREGSQEGGGGRGCRLGIDEEGGSGVCVCGGGGGGGDPPHPCWGCCPPRLQQIFYAGHPLALPPEDTTGDDEDGHNVKRSNIQ